MKTLLRNEKMAETATKQTAETVKTKATVVAKINIRDMIGRLLTIRHGTFIQLWQTTEPAMLKTGNPFLDKVTKRNCLNCLTGYQYESMVKNARSRETYKHLKTELLEAGVPIEKIEAFFANVSTEIANAAESFKSAGLSWGNYFVDKRSGETSRVIIENTPKSGRWKDRYGFYMQVAVMHSTEPIYRWKDTETELTEDEIAEMKTYFPKKKEGARQGLVKPYIIRSPRLETIDSITFNKTNYQL